MRIVDSTPTISDIPKFLLSPANSVLCIYRRSRIGGRYEEPWLDILFGGPEAVGLNPEQRDSDTYDMFYGYKI
jgi:hypothetical protein